MEQVSPVVFIRNFPTKQVEHDWKKEVVSTVLFGFIPFGEAVGFFVPMVERLI